MILTKVIAKRNLNKYIDVHRRIGGYYPKQIIELPDGSLSLKDPNGVCSPIEDKGFNAVHYDFFTKKATAGTVTEEKQTLE